MVLRELRKNFFVELKIYQFYFKMHFFLIFKAFIYCRCGIHLYNCTFLKNLIFVLLAIKTHYNFKTVKNGLDIRVLARHMPNLIEIDKFAYSPAMCTHGHSHGQTEQNISAEINPIYPLTMPKDTLHNQYLPLCLQHP